MPFTVAEGACRTGGVLFVPCRSGSAMNDSLLYSFTSSLQFLLLRRQILPAILADAYPDVAFKLRTCARRAAVGANQHNIGDIDGRFLLGDAALGPLTPLAGNRLLDHVHVLHEHRALVGKYAQHAPRLAAVRAPENLDHIIAMNFQTRHLFSKCSY